MEIIKTSVLSSTQKTKIRKLWNQEYPEKLMLNENKDFENYLNSLKQKMHYLLINEESEIAGWGIIFERDKEKWFALILDHKIQGKGFGNMLLYQLKNRAEKLNAWVIDKDNCQKSDGTIYKSPLLFYLKNGFVCKPEIRLENEQLSAVKIEWTAE